jgi:hypothetical protein
LSAATQGVADRISAAGAEVQERPDFEVGTALAVEELTELVPNVPSAIVDLVSTWRAARFDWRRARALREQWGGLRWGGFMWSPAAIARADSERRICVEQGYFEDGSDAASANPRAAEIWAAAFAWLSMNNGDALALDADEAVIYLSHDGDPLHGRRLAPSVDDFFRRWAQIGFAGPESHMIEAFIDRDGICIECDAAQSWRDAWNL